MGEDYLGGKNAKGNMIRSLIVIISLLTTSPLFAQVNLEATGYDYVEFSPQQKTEFVDTLFTVLKVDRDKYTIENGVVSLDALYYIYYHEVVNSSTSERAIETVFSKYVFEVFAEIMLTEPDIKPDEAMMKKYGLHLKGAL